MYKLLYTFGFIFCAVFMNAQLVITEIMYNPPESGQDSLEYIEIYNAGDVDLHLLNYKFTRGVEFTFPDITLEPDNYLLLTVNAAAFLNVYGKPSIQWSAGALNNTGEQITIVDSLNNELANATYSNLAPWPTRMDGTDGEGRSIELCGPLADANQGVNWKVSENDLMIMLNGKNIFGTPGEMNSIAPCTPLVDVIVEVSSNQFTPKDITIDAGQTVRWENKGGTHNVNGSLAVFPNNPEGFSSGSPTSGNWVFDYTFTKPGFYNYRCDLHFSLGMTGTVTVLEDITPDPYPLRTIVSLKGVDGNGVADSLNITCTVQGTVYGVNMRPEGLQFTLMDELNHGIGIFNSNNSFGYTVTEGDKIEAKGTVAQFRGLTQINVLEVNLLASNQTLVNPKEVLEFQESDESSLVVIKNVSFVDKGQWGNGTASGFDLDMTNGQTTFAVRIDKDVDLFNMPVPSGNLFNVTGLLSQFTTATQPPFQGGYQLLPRYMDDFVEVTSTYQENIFELNVFPNPTYDYIEISQNIVVDNVQIFDMSGKEWLNTVGLHKIEITSLPAGQFKMVVYEGQNTHIATFIKL